MNNAWEIIEITKKAAIYKGMLDGVPSYLVTIGLGKKIPVGFDNFKRDREGQLITKGSWWHYKCWETCDPEKVKEGAFRLYNNFS